MDFSYLALSLGCVALLFLYYVMEKRVVKLEKELREHVALEHDSECK